MLKFLLDENLSHETAVFLQLLGYDTKTVAQFGLEGAEDVKIAEKTAQEKRILITLDLDFGEIFYFATEKNLWIIVLRIRNQTVESVNNTLRRLLDAKILERKTLRNTLLIVEERRIRVKRKV